MWTVFVTKQILQFNIPAKIQLNYFAVINPPPFQKLADVLRKLGISRAYEQKTNIWAAFFPKLHLKDGFPTHFVQFRP